MKTMNRAITELPKITGNHISGVPIVFNQETELYKDYDGKSICEIIPDSTDIKIDDVILTLANHDYKSLPLARYISNRPDELNTLKITRDEAGIGIDSDLMPESPSAQDLICALSRHDIFQMSFTFSDWIYDIEETEDKVLMTLKSFVLTEVSSVTYPAYPGTAVEIEKLVDEAREKTQRKQERKFCAGFVL